MLVSAIYQFRKSQERKSPVLRGEDWTQMAKGVLLMKMLCVTPTSPPYTSETWSAPVSEFCVLQGYTGSFTDFFEILIIIIYRYLFHKSDEASVLEDWVKVSASSSQTLQQQSWWPLAPWKSSCPMTQVDWSFSLRGSDSSHCST